MAALGAAVCILSVGLPAQQTAAPPYTVVTRDARRGLAVRTINGQEMFALDDLARLFNLAVREDALAGGLTVTAGTQTIVLSPQQVDLSKFRRGDLISVRGQLTQGNNVPQYRLTHASMIDRPNREENGSR